MADRQFTYRVDIDTASAKAAADATRAMFANSISGAGGASDGNAQTRKMADFQINQSNRVANARIRDIERVAAAERTQAAKTGTTQQGGSSIQGVLKTGFLAYGAYLATQQATQAAVDFGRTGAQQLRTMETFKQLGDQIGVNAEDMAQAVKKATNSSVSDMQAMQLSANILAQRFATNIDDVAGDTAVLAKASRRLAQVYADENGDLMSTEQVFSRLVKFAREGNKELVDQFGISNQLIAETLGISTDGLRGAEGAENRWKGMVQILNEELARLGDPVDSTADRMEKTFARMNTALDKLRQAAAEPIVIAVEWAGDKVDDFATGILGIKALKESENLWDRSLKETSPALDMVHDSLQVLNNALVSGKMGLPEYTANVMFVVDAFHKMESAAKLAVAQMEALRLQSARLTLGDFDQGGASAQGAASFRMDRFLAGKIAPSEMNEAERDFRMSVGDASEKVRILEAVVAAAVGDTEAWSAAMLLLTGAQLDLAGEMDAVKTRFIDQQKEIADYKLDLRMGAAGSDAERVEILRGLGLSDDTPEGRENALKIQDLEMAIIEENKRLGEEAQREWMQTAKEVERLFESAADKLMSIPGVSSLTAVTEGEMLDAKYGVYREQPDEWLRQGRDELLNKVDHPNVSREQMEALAGLPAGLPPELLIGRVEEKWQSGSLFADPANLGLMNMDAIKGRYEEMKAGETGRANQKEFIMEQLGISAQDAALITGQQAPIVQMLTGGQSNEEISSQLGGTLDSVMKLTSGNMDMKDMAKTIGGGLSSAFDPGSKDYIDVAGATLIAWQGQFNSEDTIKGIRAMGKMVSQNFFGGFVDSVTSSAWAQSIISVIMADLNKALTAAAAAS